MTSSLPSRLAGPPDRRTRAPKWSECSGNDIADKIQEDPYRFLICVEKFQTGYDEPLLHTMYVDKMLSGIKAVQTLSRLNRAHPKKHDVFVLDFQNETETIEKSFADYYRTTILSKETDPNKLHTLKAELDKYHVYSPEQIGSLVELYLGGAEWTALGARRRLGLEAVRENGHDDTVRPVLFGEHGAAILTQEVFLAETVGRVFHLPGTAALRRSVDHGSVA